MSDQEKVLKHYPDATCFTKDVYGKPSSLIRAENRDLTGWCYTEERAWALAAKLCEQRQAGKRKTEPESGKSDA